MPQTSRHTHTRYNQYKTPSAGAGGGQSVMSVRSFAAFENDDIEDEGRASVPDILSRRPSMGETSVAETVASPITFKRRWAETASLTFSNNHPDHLGRPKSTQSNPEYSRVGLVTSIEPGDPQSAETRSPSTPPRSLFSRSTKSKANSSSSSIVPILNSALPGLQSKRLVDQDGLEPLAEEKIDPSSFDLVSPCHSPALRYSLEARSEALFSIDHLHVIFDDPLLFQRFTDFLYAFRPRSIPLLVYYLDAAKALKAIGYANAITQSLAPIRGLDFSEGAISSTLNESLLIKATDAFHTLAREDLPAYITHTWIQIVNVTIKRRIADTLPVHLKDLSEGLAEVFCLTDPSRHDNPIVFASEEFHRTTQYGMGHVLGRNCRFLQGPNTNLSSIRRIREHLEAGKEHCETFLNYRRDGSPFMNLLMIAPLFDSRGVIRYHIGAQIDVSGLAKECAGLESLTRLVGPKHSDVDPGGEAGAGAGAEASVDPNGNDEFRGLAKMFSLQELKTVQEAGGAMHRTRQEETGKVETASDWHQSRLLITENSGLQRHDSDTVLNISISSGGRPKNVYEHYLLVRPYPSLRVLFASPSMRIPGMLQSSFTSRIGGSRAVREAIVQAFADGHGVTAKIRWVTRTDSYGKRRWIHCTPLLGANGAVGVWMVVLVDDETEALRRRTRDAPPVDLNIGKRQPLDEDRTNTATAAEADKGVGERPPSAPRNAMEENQPRAHTPMSSNSAPHETRSVVM